MFVNRRIYSFSAPGILTFIFFLTQSFPVMGSTFYISPSGSDLNTGTSQAQPWQTIAKVNATVFSPGDSILFEGGQTISGNISFSAPNCGTAVAPIRIGSYGTGKATIDAGAFSGIEIINCAGFEIFDLIIEGDGRATNDRHGVLFYATVNTGPKHEYIYLHNLEVSGFNQGGITLYSDPTFTDIGYKDVTITDCVVHDNGDHGINVFGKVLTTGYAHEDFYIAHCKAYDNPGALGKNFAHTGNGIVVGNTDTVMIEFCEAYNNGADNTYNGGGPVGIWVWDCRKGTIQFSESYNNKTGSTKDGGGFDIDGGCTECLIQYCYSHDNEGAGFLVAEYNGARPLRNNTIRYNISQNDGRDNDYGGIHLWKGSGILADLKIYNNVIYIANIAGTTPVAFKSTSAGIDSVLIANNIFITSGNINLVDISHNSADLEFVGNAYYSQTNNYRYDHAGTLYTSLNAWRTGEGQEILTGNPLGFEGDPKVINPGGGGTIGDPTLLFSLNAYKLLSTSPLLDSGLNLNTLFALDVGTQDFFNNTIPANGLFDIGAEESKGSPLSVSTPYFYARRLNNTRVLLQWQLDADIEIREVSIERKFDGMPQTEQLASFPDLQGPQQWVDHNDLGIPSYYRLKLKNVDGEWLFTDYQEVEGSKSPQKSLEVFPQPFRDRISIRIPGAVNEAFRLEILDIAGKLLTSREETTGYNQILELENLDSLSSGNYLIKVIFPDRAYHKNILKE